MDQIKDIVFGVFVGAFDAIYGIFAIRRFYLEDKRNNKNNIFRSLGQCILLNGVVFGVSIVLFKYIMLQTVFILMQLSVGSKPGRLSSIWLWLEPTLTYTFSAFWVLPLFVISRIVNALWFQDIANFAYRGRPQAFRNFPTFIADTLFSLLIQALFLFQALLVEFIPISLIAKLVSLFHLSLLYALYSFEYKWYNMGWEVHRRLHFIENNWPYYLGFGLPLSLVTYWPDSYFLSGCIFSILFPLFIISANEAKPKTDYKDIEIHFFKIVVWLSNKILFLIFRLNMFGNRR